MKLINDVFFKNIKEKNIYDSLTGVLNKEYILKYTKYLIDNNEKFSLFFVDLDYFKDINDILGHETGDNVLIKTCQIINELLIDKDTICGRFGGDEFIIIYKNIDDYNDVWKVGEAICKDITNKALTEKTNTYGDITVTIGIASYPKDCNNFDELLDKVDKALSRGKLKGRNCFIIYNEALHGNIRNNMMSILNTEQLIQFVFEELNDKSKTIDERIVKVMSFTSRYYNIDYASIVRDDCLRIVCKSDIAQLDELNIIPKQMYDELGYNNSHILAINYTRRIKPEEIIFRELLLKDDIRAQLIIQISTKTKKYGYLRFDLINERVWQKETKLIAQIIAEIYANLLENEMNSKD